MNKEDLEYDISIALHRLNEAATFTLAGIDGLTCSDLYVLKVCCDYYDEHGSLPRTKLYSQKIYDVLTHYGML